MDPLGDQLTNRPIQTGWKFTMQLYLSRLFWFIDDPDRQFGNGLVRTRTWTGSDAPEPLLTLTTGIWPGWNRTAVATLSFLQLWLQLSI